MRFVLRDSGTDEKNVGESCFGNIINIDFEHLKHVGLFRIHGGYALTDNMKYTFEDKFFLLRQYSKYKVSMDVLQINHVESEEIAKINRHMA